MKQLSSERFPARPVREEGLSIEAGGDNQRSADDVVLVRLHAPVLAVAEQAAHLNARPYVQPVVARVSLEIPDHAVAGDPATFSSVDGQAGQP